jgi:hypothetical protein
MNKRPTTRLWIALCFGFGLTACASSMANTKIEDARGLIDLNARVPVGDSPYGIAYGAPQPGRVQPLAPDIDRYLKPNPAPARVAKVAPAPQPQPQPFEPVVNLEPNREQLLALAAEPPAPVSHDSSRYAQREAQSQNLEKFRGGDVIVITTGTLIVILLVVILILLLT